MPSEQIVKKSVCMWCHCHCRVMVYIEDGQPVRVTENTDEQPMDPVYPPTVRGCPRVRAVNSWYNNPERLNYPLKRVGERGENKWQRISWEQALDEIAAELREIKDSYGPEAIATSSGTGRTHDEYRVRFFHLLGSPNHFGQGHICFGLTNIVSSAIVGFTANIPELIPEVTKCVLYLGINPAQAERRRWIATLNVQKAGGKLIVIDPRRTEAADRADIWLQLRPGTDTALLMSLIDVILTEGLYDREFVGKWCHGFEELAQRAREYAPEKVAETTGVPAAKMREAARMYATNRPAASVNKMGLEHLANSVEACQARFILSIITGNIDARGADVMRGISQRVLAQSEVEVTELLPPEQKAKALGVDRFRLMCYPGYDYIQGNVVKVWGKKLPKDHHCFAHAPSVFRAMLTSKPYPVRGLITNASNPLVTMPNAKLVYKALKSLDLYVVMDFFLTPSAQLADYVLPAASWLERPVLWTFDDTSDAVFAYDEIFSPYKEEEYERRTDFDFWRGLGVRLDQEKYWPWKNLEEAYDYRLSPQGLTFKQFITEKGGYDFPPLEYKKYERTGFATPTGKAELYCTTFEKLGYDPLPQFYEAAESPVSSPELAREYPLILITGGRFLPMYHSEWRQVEEARQQHSDPLMQIHQQTAAAIGLEEGDWVWIETPRGRVRQKCQLFNGIAPGVVHAEHGWWFPELPGEEPWLHGAWESNINVVTDDEPEHCNKLSGGWPLRTGLCKVYPVKKY